jgi:hypothetical protein
MSQIREELLSPEPPMSIARLLTFVSVCISCSFCIGCGGSTVPTAIRGLALYRGEPLAGGTVVFTPNAEKGSAGPIATGTIQPDGSFSLETPDGKPIAAGWYRVAVAAGPGMVDIQTVDRPYPGLPARYRIPTLSGLEREVKSGMENRFEFDLD